MENRVWNYWKWSTIILLLCSVAVLLIDRNSLFLFLNNNSAIFPDHFWGIMTNLGDGFVACLIVLCCAHKRPDFVRASLIATAVALPIIQGLKYYTTVLRPGILLSEMTNAIGHHPSSWAFPSGHTATVAVVFGVIWFMADSRTIRWSALVVMLFASFSRIAVGVHWPIDVVIGLIVGISCAAVGSLLTKNNRDSTLGTRIVVLIVSLASLNFMTDYHLTPNYPLLQKIFGTMALLFGIRILLFEFIRSVKWKT